MEIALESTSQFTILIHRLITVFADLWKHSSCNRASTNSPVTRSTLEIKQNYLRKQEQVHRLTSIKMLNATKKSRMAIRKIDQFLILARREILTIWT